MTVFTSSLNLSSEQHKGNRVRNEGLVSELRDRLKQVHGGGSSAAVALHRKRGKLLAQERIAALLDPGSFWLDLSPLAAWDLYDNQVPAAGLMTGIGFISGRPCVMGPEKVNT